MISFYPEQPGLDPEVLGFIPHFLDSWDDRPAREQLDENYNRLAGCSWSPIPEFTMGPLGELLYPGDAAMSPLASAKLRGETIRVYDYGFVSITQPDGTFEAARMD
jgi:hypothetical protein